MNAESCRPRAAECIARAEAATDSRIKSYNQSEAEMWLRMAELTEKQKLAATSAGGRGSQSADAFGDKMFRIAMRKGVQRE
jgi:hypothetical protein